MSDTFFKPVLTAAGQTAALNAVQGGFQVRVTEIRFGRGQYDTRLADGTPNPDAVAATDLIDPVVTVQANGVAPTASSLVVVGTLERGEPFDVSEIGFYLEDGTLLAVASAAGQVFYSRSQFIDLPTFFSLGFSVLPAGSITIEAPQDATFAALLARLVLVEATFQQTIIDAGIIYDPSDINQLSQAIQAQIASGLSDVELSEIDGLQVALDEKADAANVTGLINQLMNDINGKADANHQHFTTRTFQTVNANPVALLTIPVQEAAFLSLEGIGDAFVPADNDANPALPPDGTFFHIQTAASRHLGVSSRKGLSGVYLHEESSHPLGLALDVAIDQDNNTLQIIATGIDGRAVDWMFDYTLRERTSS